MVCYIYDNDNIDKNILPQNLLTKIEQKNNTFINALILGEFDISLKLNMNFKKWYIIKPNQSLLLMNQCISNEISTAIEIRVR